MRISAILIGLFATTAASASLSACGHIDGCRAHRNCGPYVPPEGGIHAEGGAGDGGSGGGTGGGSGSGSGDSGPGGADGAAGGGAGGKDGGSGGSGGMTDGGSGAGGMGTDGGDASPDPCGGTCSGDTPVCDESQGECVECTEGAHCGGNTPACDDATHACVECTENGDCTGSDGVCDEATHSCVECVESTDCSGDTPVCDGTTQTCVECTEHGDCDGATPLCDTAANVCVECLDNSTCTAVTASLCESGSCTACQSNADCSHLSDTTVCDAGECVECTGLDYTACGEDKGTPFVCDSLARSCTDKKEHAAGACVPCVSDAHCQLGQVCMLQTFGTEDEEVGYFCHWKQGDTDNGAPKECFPGGRPFVAGVKDALSIDGETTDVCGLRVSTCIARNQFGIKDCAAGGPSDDSVCGFGPPADAKCDQVGASSSYRCTMTCGTDDDCPINFSCNTTALNPYCEL